MLRQDCNSLSITQCALFVAPYQPPGNLTAEATNSTSIFVQWNAVVLPNIRGILRGYTVYYKEAPSSVHPSVLRNVSVHISVTEAELVNLHKFTEYHIWVTAFTTREGWLSNSIFVRTYEDSKCRLLIKHSRLPAAYRFYKCYGSKDIGHVNVETQKWHGLVT